MSGLTGSFVKILTQDFPVNQNMCSHVPFFKIPCIFYINQTNKNYIIVSEDNK